MRFNWGQWNYLRRNYTLVNVRVLLQVLDHLLEFGLLQRVFAGVGVVSNVAQTGALEVVADWELLHSPEEA